MRSAVGCDVDPVHRTVTVRDGFHVLKGGRDAVEAPKFDTSRRSVELSEIAAEVLGRSISCIAWGARAFPFRPDTVTHSMFGACMRAEVKHPRFHDLLHTHATLLLASGANIKAVSSRLGHSSVSITLDTHGHVLPGMDRVLGGAMDGILGTEAIKKPAGALDGLVT